MANWVNRLFTTGFIVCLLLQCLSCLQGTLFMLRTFQPAGSGDLAPTPPVWMEPCCEVQPLPYRLHSPGLTKLLFKGQESPDWGLHWLVLTARNERSIHNFNIPWVPLTGWRGEEPQQRGALPVCVGEEKPGTATLHNDPGAAAWCMSTLLVCTRQQRNTNLFPWQPEKELRL